MPKHPTPIAKRVAQTAAFTVGGGVALAFALAGSAHADTIAAQNANVTNTGGAVANSGGNVAVGNASNNTADSNQQATGGIANNSGGASNTSNGTASITTGAATAVGNDSQTTVGQAVAAPDPTPAAPAPLVVSVQNANVTNAGGGVANSGGNLAIGNASTNDATSKQQANGGLIGNNSGGASNSSNGTASIATGAATAVGNDSQTTIGQGTDAGDGTGAGLAVVVQNAGVANLGFGLGNSGGNLAIGNISDNTASSDQKATGLIANNAGGASNASDGSATIVTGNATGIGNLSSTTIGQGADADPGGLAVVLQNAPVLNAGIGVANSGLDGAIGNGSLNSAILAQVSFGLLANNVGGASNWSNGFAMVLTGSATGVGNDSTTGVVQTV